MKFFPRGRQSFALALALGHCMSFSLLPALAAGNSIQIGGTPLFSVNSGAEGLSSSSRAEKIQKNIDNSLVASSNHGPSSVKITYVKGVPVITLGGYLVTTVDTATAKAAGTTPSLLAQKWANSLKAGLANKASVDQYIAHLSGSSYSNSSTVASLGSKMVSTPPKSTPSAKYSAPAKTVASKPKIVSAPKMAKASPAKVSSAPSYSSIPVDTAAGTTTAFDYDSASDPNTAAASAPSGYQSNNSYSPQYGSVKQGRVVYVPAGMQIPIKLATSLSSQVAKAGDTVIAKTTESVELAGASIPAGSTITGQVTESSNGRYMAKSGRLGIKFTSLRTPDGTETPISAHITGGASKYTATGELYRGENTMSKVKKAAIATAIGAGAGAALGIAVGSVAAGGRGAGRGAWSGVAIGAGLGLAQSLLLRKGSEVNLSQGEEIKIQLDAPLSLALGG